MIPALAATTLVLFSTLAWLIIPNSPPLVGTTIKNIKTHEKVVALTFDDGPNPPYTEQTLSVLEKHQVKATFFMVGKRAKKFPALVQQVYMQGHEIGNHTWDHHVLVGKSCKFIRNQIAMTDKLLRQLGYTGPIHFRSPKGMKFLALQKVLKKIKRPNILFDVVSWDWSRPGVNKIVANVMKNVKPGSIILLHDGDGDHNDRATNRSQTVQSLDCIITRLKERGYRFATISELLGLRRH